jgi:hypothetical protein
VQAGNSWTLVPDQISDSDLAALNLSGEVDGTVPAQLLASAPPPAAAPAPPPAAAPAPAAPVVVDKLVRNYNVIYGAQSVVSIAGGDGGYTVTAKGPLHWKVPNPAAPQGSCDLPDGSIIATFSLSADATYYSGQHGNWDKSCQFIGWGDMVLQLKGTLVTGHYAYFGGAIDVSFSPA